jgi:branched-chain amino acid transport system permease protein
MSFLFIQLLSGLANAMFLFLVASGLTLIFGVTRIVNFAHGSFYMLAAYLTLSLVHALPLGGAAFYVAVLLAALLVAAVGGLVEIGLLRRVYRAPELYQLLLTFALVLVVADAVKYLWGADNKTGPNAPGLAGSVRLAGQLFPTYDLAMIVFGPLVALGLWALFYRTRMGILIRAATQDREMVAALGVDQSRLFTGVFVLGSFLAGLAGALQVPRVAITTVMDTTVIVEAFVVVVIGGMGSVWGALLASILIGVLGAYGILLLPRVSIVLIFVVMAVVLIVRPWGLLGRPEAALRPAGGGAEAAPRPRLRPGWVAAGALLLITVPPFLPTFHVWLLVEMLAFTLFASSLYLLMGGGGLVSFGHAAYFGLGAYGAAVLMKHAGFPMPLAFLGAPLLAAVAGVVFGYFSVRLTSIYFAMLTLAFAQIVYAIVHQWDEVTGGDNGLLGVWPSPWLASPLRYYFMGLAATALGLALLLRVAASPFGLALRAARDHPRRAEAVGLNIGAHQHVAFVVAALVAGLGGAIFVYLKGSVFPNYVDAPMSVQPLVMVLLGGIGSPVGPPLGAVVYKLLDTVITRYTEYWQAVLGVILIALVLAFPRGLASVLDFLPLGWGGASAAPPPDPPTASTGLGGASAAPPPDPCTASTGLGGASAAPPPDPCTASTGLGGSERRASPDLPHLVDHMSGRPVLETVGLTKRFGGVVAVDGVNLSLPRGEIRALIGPNGAGKTTCFNMLAGQLVPDGGEVRFKGERLSGLAPYEVWRRGVSRTFQITAAFTSLTALDNVLVARLSHRRRTYALLASATRLEVDEARARLAQVGLAEQADRTAAVLAYGDLKRLELAVALANDPELLLLDEPTAGMAPAERGVLMALVERLARERGLTVLFTEHDMDVVFAVADRIMVLHQGRLVAEGKPAEVRADRDVQRVYLGELGEAPP